MAIGVVVHQPLAEPADGGEAEVAPQPSFDLLPRQRRVAVGVEQAFPRRQDQPGAIAIDRAAFQHPIRHL